LKTNPPKYFLRKKGPAAAVTTPIKTKKTTGRTKVPPPITGQPPTSPNCFAALANNNNDGDAAKKRRGRNQHRSIPIEKEWALNQQVQIRRARELETYKLFDFVLMLGISTHLNARQVLGNILRTVTSTIQPTRRFKTSPMVGCCLPQQHLSTVWEWT
jgi:hypothetical protein